ncbi:MAG: sensor histidine kinase [Gaiellaceae bacterium]
MTTLALILAFGLVTIVASAVLVPRLPTLQLQLASLALLAVCLPLAVVLASGLVMLGIHHDGAILAVAIASALSALVSAYLLGRRVLQPLGRLSATSARVAGGDLSARASESGPRELRELGAAFNEMAAGVEQLFDARRELVAWASHDLRTPLASLRAMVEALEDGLASPDEYVPAIRAQTEILSRLVDDLFELAMIDAGALRLELREVRLGSLVSECVGAVEPEARAQQVRLETRVATDATVLMAPDKIERVLLNLLTNAVRHAAAHGTVAVVVEPDTNHVLISVEDTGDGLDHDAPQRMFDRFWRADDSRARSNGGAGLGLAIAQGLVHAHGGRIWAENRAEGGARVAFTLPLTG